jgi:hypothetical protein
MAETVNTNQFKNGMHIAIDGSAWRILEFQHVKPGKGGAFVRSRLRNLDTGAVVDKTFRAGEKFPRIRTEVKDVQYLYDRVTGGLHGTTRTTVLADTRREDALAAWNHRAPCRSSGRRPSGGRADPSRPKARRGGTDRVGATPSPM